MGKINQVSYEILDESLRRSDPIRLFCQTQRSASEGCKNVSRKTVINIEKIKVIF
jgi:hypothetical protein